MGSTEQPSDGADEGGGEWSQRLKQGLRRALAKASTSHTSEDVVRAAFQALLGRPPEPAALEAGAQRLSTSAEALQDWLQDLLLSPESAQRNARLLVAGLSQFDGQPDIISLGTHCYTSQLLKTLGLKHWSGPFDWIFSSLPMVTHCLEDDFVTFLDRRELEPVPEEQRLGPGISRCDHRHYRDRFGVHHVFNHHDAHLDDGYAYFQRCVARLRGKLALDRPKTLLLCTHERSQSQAQLLQLRDALERRTQNFRVVAVSVRPSTGNLWAQLSVQHQDDTLHVYALTPSSTWEPLQFADPADDLCVARALERSALR